MNNYLKSYIDRQLIDLYAEDNKLQLIDIPDTELTNFLDVLAVSDPALKDLILDHAQELINDRLRFIADKNLINSGYFPDIDENTGEVSWVLPRNGGY